MAAYENFVHIEGNLARDPEVRFTSAGDPVCHLTIAQSARVRVDGEWTDGPTSYFDVSVWGKLGLNANDSLGRGSRVVVEGQLQQRSWADKETGEKRYKIEIKANSVALALRFAPAMAIEAGVQASTEMVPAGMPVDEEPFDG